MPGVRSATGKTPAVLLGEAREQLQRALLFGDTEEIATAQRNVDRALKAQAVERRARRAHSIRAALAEIPSSERAETLSPIERAAQGQILTSELYEQWSRDPESLQLKPYEKQFVKGDIRRVRALVEAHRSGATFDAVLARMRVAESPNQREYALAARADDPRELPAVQNWLVDYLGCLDE